MNLKNLLPVPNIYKAKRVLCVQAHADDNDIGAGGTIAVLAKKGVEIYYATVTDDASGFIENTGTREERAKIREEEQKASGAILGIKDYFWLNYPDAGQYSLYDVRQDLIKIIRQIKPDFLMTMDPWLTYEAHADHITAGLAASQAAMFYGMTAIEVDKEVDAQYKPHAMYGIAYYFTGRPNTVIDITETREAKYEAISKHKSQFKEPEFNMLKMYMDMQSQDHAKDKGFKYGEALKILNPNMQLHCMPETEHY